MYIYSRLVSLLAEKNVYSVLLFRHFFSQRKKRKNCAKMHVVKGKKVVCKNPSRILCF